MTDYKKIENKDGFIEFKSKCMSELDEYINGLINENYKQSVILTYWIRSFKNYLKQEKTFESKYLPVYKYGSVVEIDLGYRVGSEFGGQHYGIVINKKDKKANPNLTIIPMRSMKNNIHYTEVDIGKEFYNLAENKVELLTQQKTDLVNKYLEDIDKLEENYKNNNDEDNKNDINRLNERSNNIITNIKELNLCLQRISKLKYGSIALPNQVLTISKMRVRDPISTRDTLYGITLSDSTMEKIKKEFDRIYF